MKDPSSLMEINNFWRRQILEKDVVHKQDAGWIGEIKMYLIIHSPREWKDSTLEGIIEAVKQTLNWKSIPGLDMVHNFRIEDLTTLHPTLKALYNVIMKDTSLLPQTHYNNNNYNINNNDDDNNNNDSNDSSNNNN